MRRFHFHHQEAESKETTEMFFVPAATPTAAPTLIRPRQFGVRYDVDSHAPSRSLFLTSNADGLVNRQLYVASLDAPADWTPVTAGSEGAACAPVLAHSDTRSIDDVSAFDGFLAVSGREDGFTQLWVVPLDGAGGAAADAHRLAFEDASFTAYLGKAAGGKPRPACLTTAPHRPAWCFPRAQGAPTHPGAPPEQLGSLPWPQQLTPGRPKDDDFFISAARE